MDNCVSPRLTQVVCPLELHTRLWLLTGLGPVGKALALSPSKSSLGKVELNPEYELIERMREAVLEEAVEWDEELAPLREASSKRL
ncbi:MAG TPA: hypothetical protein VIS99_15525 [Terrimicrobiaceae bacterium]